MKQPDREWLEQYRTNPRVDMAVYRNYQNPNQWQLPGLRDAAMQAGREQMQRAEAQTYEQMAAALPEHMRNLPPADILEYIRQAHTGQQNLAQERTRYDENIAQRRAQMEQQNQQRLAQQRAGNYLLGTLQKRRAAREARNRAREVNESNARIQAQLQAQTAEAERQRVAAEQQRAATQRAPEQRANDDYYANLRRTRAWDYYNWARNNAWFHHRPGDLRELLNNYGRENAVDARNQAAIFLEELGKKMGRTPDEVLSLSPDQFYGVFNQGGISQEGSSNAWTGGTYPLSINRRPIPDWKYTTYGTRFWGQ